MHTPRPLSPFLFVDTKHGRLENVGANAHAYAYVAHVTHEPSERTGFAWNVCWIIATVAVLDARVLTYQASVSYSIVW